jgi:alpha-L-fucosidase 2
VTVPADATSGASLLAVAVFTVDGQAQSLQRTGVITIPAPSLTAAFDNVGITDDGNTTIGNIDGAGSSFSAQALAADGATPGATVTYDGVPFTWPDVTPGHNDNAIADGRAFDIHGSGSSVSFLLTAGYGPASGIGTVVYTDGSSDQFQLSAPDWHGGCKSATDPGVALYMPYRNRASGQNALPVCVFYASAPIASGKAVARIFLPNVSADVKSGQPSMHIFAVTIH